MSEESGGLVPYDYDELDVCEQCTATSKSTGERCVKPARTGYTVCEVHGAGKGLKHPGDANLKHGKYSKFRLFNVGDMVDEFRENMATNDLTNELAIARATLQAFLDRLNTEEAIANNLIGVMDDVSAVAAIARLIDSIGQLATRMQKIRESDAIPRDEVIRLIAEMYAVAQQTVSDPEEMAELEQGWAGIHVIKTGRKRG